MKGNIIMTKFFQRFVAVAVACVMMIGLTACRRNDDVQWISPMFSVTTASSISVWNSAEHGTIERSASTISGGSATIIGSNANISEAQLLDRGAIKATTNLAYEGDGEYFIRIGASTQSFINHGRAGANVLTPADVRILWRHPDTNNWWDVRDSGLGNTATAGEHTHQSLRNGNNTYSFRLNVNTVTSLASIEFYIVVLAAPVPTANINQSDSDHRVGIIVTFEIEVADADGHFHSWEIIASTSTSIVITA